MVCAESTCPSRLLRQDTRVSHGLCLNQGHSLPLGWMMTARETESFLLAWQPAAQTSRHVRPPWGELTERTRSPPSACWAWCQSALRHIVKLDSPSMRALKNGWQLPRTLQLLKRLMVEFWEQWSAFESRCHIHSAWRPVSRLFPELHTAWGDKPGERELLLVLFVTELDKLKGNSNSPF